MVGDRVRHKLSGDLGRTVEIFPDQGNFPDHDQIQVEFDSGVGVSTALAVEYVLISRK